MLKSTVILIWGFPLVKNYHSGNNGMLNEELLSQDDQLLQDLWRTYFKAICIRERLNPRKQLNDMPRRYWKYLTEKQ